MAESSTTPRLINPLADSCYRDRFLVGSARILVSLSKISFHTLSVDVSGIAA